MMLPCSGERKSVSLFESCVCVYGVGQIFTAAPPFAMGMFDRYCSADTLLHFPALYKSSQNSELFNVKVSLSRWSFSERLFSKQALRHLRKNFCLVILQCSVTYSMYFV